MINLENTQGIQIHAFSAYGSLKEFLEIVLFFSDFSCDNFELCNNSFSLTFNGSEEEYESLILTFNGAKEKIENDDLDINLTGKVVNYDETEIEF